MIDYNRKSFIYKQLFDDRMGILGLNFNRKKSLKKGKLIFTDKQKLKFA